MRWINRRPDRFWTLVLSVLPFALLALAYATGSAARLAANPNDRLLPSIETIAGAFHALAFVADPRTGSYLFWTDTLASLSRLGAALGIATGVTLVVSLAIGLLPVVRTALAPFVATLSMVPPLALLPVLFIVMGLGESSKIALIAIGVTPVMIRDLSGKIAELPREQWIKAQTLGASSWQIALRMVLPQAMPRLLTSLRLQLGPAWLFLIAAEAISSDSGLGYRIFLVRRYLSMDVIFTYVVWITILALAMNLVLEGIRRRAFPWSNVGGAA